MAARARRSLPLWLPAVGAVLGVALLAVRLATVPLDETDPVLALLIVAVAVTVVLATVRALRRRTRLRAAIAAHPHSFVLPVVGGIDTAAASRWLATHLDRPGLALRPDRDAILVLDATGLRVVDGTTASAPIPAADLSVLPLTRARAGTRPADALALGVAVGGVVVPFPLVPARSGLVTLGMLSDAELLDVSARIRNALAGDPAAGWPY